MSKAPTIPQDHGSYERDPKTGALKRRAGDKDTIPADVPEGRGHKVDKAAAAAAAEASAAAGFPAPAVDTASAAEVADANPTPPADAGAKA